MLPTDRTSASSPVPARSPWTDAARAQIFGGGGPRGGTVSFTQPTRVGAGVSGEDTVGSTGAKASSMALWANAQQSGDYDIPDYVDELMTAAGYKRKDTSTKAEDVSGLDMKQAKKLSEFRSGVSSEDMKQFIDSYGNHYDAPGKPAEDSHWTRPAVSTETVTTAPMTLKAYNALTPEQRAAVDFNTALIASREKDVGSGWLIKKVPEEARSKYKQMFGEDAPTAGFAENTLALLERVKYQGDATLQNFMSLDMAVDTDELKGLNFAEKLDLGLNETPESQMTEGQKRRHKAFINQPEGPTKESWDAFRRTASQEYQNVLQVDVVQKAGELLKGYSSEAPLTPRGDALTAFGVGGPETQLPLGWGDPRNRSRPVDRQRETDFQNVLTTLAKDTGKFKLAESPGFWNGMATLGFKEQDFTNLFSFLDAKTRWMIDHGETLGEGLNDPRTIREMAGLEPIK